MTAKKYMNTAKDMVASGVILGTGASITTSIGGTAGVNASKGLANMSSMMPVMGTVAGAGTVVGMLGNLTPSRKKRRR